MRYDTYDEAGAVLTAEAGSVLGILRHRTSEVMTAGGERLDVPETGRAMLREPQTLIIVKTNQESRVHRRANPPFHDAQVRSVPEPWKKDRPSGQGD